MKKLAILIPQYKETEEVIKPLLDSIAVQQHTDFKNDIEVIITNDGTDVHLSEEFLKSYPFEIQYYLNEHKGVSATRNACLDKATAEYVMFCDADDMFYNVCAFYIIFREITAGGFDGLVSMFIEETRTPDRKEIVYINRQMDSTFVHGKIYKRKYLLERNIRWNENLTIHEDSYFNCLCQKLSNNVKYCQIPFYLWRWRDDSVCRNDFKYILKTYNNMLDSSTALVEEFLKRGHYEDAQFYCTSMVFDAYYTMNKKEWIDQENKEYRNTTEMRFKDYFLKFKDLFDNTPENIKAQIISSIKNRFFGEGLFMESITFDDWIKHIQNMEVKND